MGYKKITSVTMVTLLSLVALSSAWAKPTTSSQAMAVVKAWRQQEKAPLKSALGKSTKAVKTFQDSSGSDLYHVVTLEPSGFAVVPADDLVEPIIAFSSDGIFDPSDTNPLGALVSRDLPGRIARAREGVASASIGKSEGLISRQVTAADKWEQLQSSDTAFAAGTAVLSDMRVEPLIQSKWDQDTINGNVCYNYYTPNNDVSGCVATALSQLMRFYQLPTFAVGTPSFTISVDGVSRSEPLMGGNGSGGAYNWSQMPLVPDATTTDAQRQAIGRLLHDTGVRVSMSYTATSSSADTFKTADALKNTFGYTNAVKGYNGGSDFLSAARNTMVNPNLDAGLPVLFAITGSYGGHAVVGDGYGYQSGTMYHHLNMGWGGNSDTWYNLPNIDSSTPFTSVIAVIFNIYTSGSGEIVSGRIVDCAGAPASGVTVTASYNSAIVASATTNSYGIYALKGLGSAKTYTIAATKNGFTFTSQTATTGTSTDFASTSGNKWGVDFANTICSASTLNITKSGSGSGSVTSSPAGISCGATCSSSFASPSSITLTPAASPGSVFIGWSGGGCTGKGSCVVSLVANTTVTATFVPVTTIFSEPFLATTIPTGWTAQDNLGGLGRNWAFGSGHCYPNNTGGSGSFAIAETNCGTGVYNVNSSLISPNYDLSQYAGISLTFKTYIKYWYDATLDVDVSDDSGVNWVNIWRKGSGTNGTYYGPTTETVDITSMAAGKANVKVRFRFYNNISTYGSYVEIDDFTLSGARISAPAVSAVVASNIMGASATFGGSINDNNATTSATFQYGQSVAYGNSISGGTILAGTGTVPVNAAIDSLNCNTTYHFRLVGSNSAGSTNGSDQTFTTTACVPDAPTITSAKAGNTQASIYFVPPSDGGSPIVSYTITPNGGTPLIIDEIPIDIPIVVSNLLNGNSYTFTVRATNATGDGAASDNSTEVIPGIVRNSGSEYDKKGYQTLQGAYDADTHTAEIQIIAGMSVGPFTKDDSDTVTVKGGFNNVFATNSGSAAILGSVSLRNGTTRFENIIIR